MAASLLLGFISLEISASLNQLQLASLLSPACLWGFQPDFAVLQRPHRLGFHVVKAGLEGLEQVFFSVVFRECLVCGDFSSPLSLEAVVCLREVTSCSQYSFLVSVYLSLSLSIFYSEHCQTEAVWTSLTVVTYSQWPHVPSQNAK